MRDNIPVSTTDASSPSPATTSWEGPRRGLAGQPQPLRALRPLRVGPAHGPYSPAAHARRHRPDRLPRRPDRHDRSRHDLPAPLRPPAALHRRAQANLRGTPRIPRRARRALNPLRHRHRRVGGRRQVHRRAPPPAPPLALGLHAPRRSGHHRRLPLPQPHPSGTLPHRPPRASPSPTTARP